MTTTQEVTTMTDPDLSALTDDGDTVELDDGRTLRLRIEPDLDTDPFTDNPDFYGRIGHGAIDRDTGRERRPDGFDGAAHKLDVIDGRVWYQPPTGDYAIAPEHYAEWLAFVSELYSYGCKIVTVELLDGEDHYGRAIVRDAASLGGIDSLDNGYVHDVVTDLVSELALDTRNAPEPDDTRRAIVRGEPVERVAAYLPANYTASETDDGVLIVGRDVAGWTLDDYVIPRLASGLMFATEVTA